MATKRKCMKKVNWRRGICGIGGIASYLNKDICGEPIVVLCPNCRHNRTTGPFCKGHQQCCWCAALTRQRDKRNSLCMKNFTLQSICVNYVSENVERYKDELHLLPENVRDRIDLCFLTPEKALAQAVVYGIDDMMLVLLSKVENINSSMIEAIKLGTTRSQMELYREWGATNYDGGMWEAARYGHEDLVHLFKEWGATDYDGGMWEAARYGHEDLVHLFKEWGATNYDSGMWAAARDGHEDLVRLFKKWGATDYDGGLHSTAMDLIRSTRLFLDIQKEPVPTQYMAPFKEKEDDKYKGSQ